MEYFWGQSEWPVAAIPDPKDPDPVRYACLAALTRIMCKAYNRLIEQGIPRDAPPIVHDWDEMRTRPKTLECPPDWAMNVPKVPVMESDGGWYKIPNGKGWPEENSKEISEDFKVYGILAFEPPWPFV